MTAYESLRQQLRTEPKTWLITGVAGFIGSNLLETLLKLNQRVVGLDNFATGHQRNLDEVQTLVTPDQWSNFHFIKGDIRKLEDCHAAMTWSLVGAGLPANPLPVDFVLHQAALGSVPRSLADPITTNDTNISGFLNMLVAARDAKVKSFTYAASSSTYGDHPALPKIEENIGKPLSPYAVTKYVNELYADVFARCYGFNTIGLRYFNVFGPRQDPNGAYAAVIPKWTAALLNGEPVFVNGDGETSRDFCYVANAVQANLLAAIAADPVVLAQAGLQSPVFIASDARQSMNPALNQVYNIAVGDRTTLNQLYILLRENLSKILVERSEPMLRVMPLTPTYRDFRPGDVRHSQADIGKAQKLLAYVPTHRLSEGVAHAMPWYVNYFQLG